MYKPDWLVEFEALLIIQRSKLQQIQLYAVSLTDWYEFAKFSI